MEATNFIEGIINNINDIRNEEFRKANIAYFEKENEKKVLNEETMEFKNFKNKIRKSALLERYKPSNIGKKEYESVNQNIDILEDNIFNNNQEENEATNKLNIEEMDVEKKMELINNFLEKKNIQLDEHNLKKIVGIVNDPNINLKKYLTVSKIYQEVTKISFIKKIEDGSYEVNMSDKKVKNKTQFFK